MLRCLFALIMFLNFADLANAEFYNCKGAFNPNFSNDHFVLTLDLKANGDISKLHATRVDYGGKPYGDLGLGPDFYSLRPPLENLEWDQTEQYGGKVYRRYLLPKQIRILFSLPEKEYYLYLPQVDASKGEVLDHGYINLRKPEPYSQDYEVLLTIRPRDSAPARPNF